jgi:hypothetical protein
MRCIGLHDYASGDNHWSIESDKISALSIRKESLLEMVLVQVTFGYLRLNTRLRGFLSTLNFQSVRHCRFFYIMELLYSRATDI